jgi:hypothetical protein
LHLIFPENEFNLFFDFVDIVIVLIDDGEESGESLNIDFIVLLDIFDDLLLLLY